MLHMNSGILIIFMSNFFIVIFHIWHKNKRIFITIYMSKEKLYYMMLFINCKYLINYNWCFCGLNVWNQGWMSASTNLHNRKKKNIAFAGGETVIFYTLTPPRPKVLHFHNMSILYNYRTIGHWLHFLF